jgi:hypothetical protein
MDHIQNTMCNTSSILACASIAMVKVFTASLLSNGCLFFFTHPAFSHHGMHSFFYSLLFTGAINIKTT